MTKEWAIQNEATGEWWGCSTGVGWGNVIDVFRYSYVSAVSAVTEILRGTTTARIVPAPPREMTDAECWEWLRKIYDNGNGRGRSLAILAAHSDAAPNKYTCADYKKDELLGVGITPYDAIRAARRKLEAK